MKLLSIYLICKLFLILKLCMHGDTIYMYQVLAACMHLPPLFMMLCIDIVLNLHNCTLILYICTELFPPFYPQINLIEFIQLLIILNQLYFSNQWKSKTKKKQFFEFFIHTKPIFKQCDNYNSNNLSYIMYIFLNKWCFSSSTLLLSYAWLDYLLINQNLASLKQTT